MLQLRVYDDLGYRGARPAISPFLAGSPPEAGWNRPLWQISSFLSRRKIRRKAGQKKRENQPYPRISFLPVDLSVHVAVFEVILSETAFAYLIFLNTSSANSRWARVCAAVTQSRSRAAPCGTAGKRTGAARMP